MSTEDEAIVTAAQHRATIAGFLTQNPGEHNILSIADATGLHRRTVAPLLAAMAEEPGAHVGTRKEGTSRLYWANDNEVSMNAAPRDSKRGAAGRAAANAKRKGDKDVELVINGTQIVVGRNPATGRIRITLEG